MLTRAIAGRPNLTIAKEILQRKVLVGLYDRVEEFVERLEIFLHWNNIGNDARTCQDDKINRMLANNRNHDAKLPQEGSPTWEILMKKNGLDMALYEHAKFLFDYQGHTLFGIPVRNE